jgi:hypothetical protein
MRNIEPYFFQSNGCTATGKMKYTTANNYSLVLYTRLALTVADCFDQSWFNSCHSRNPGHKNWTYASCFFFSVCTTKNCEWSILQRYSSLQTEITHEKAQWLMLANKYWASTLWLSKWITANPIPFNSFRTHGRVPSHPSSSESPLNVRCTQPPASPSISSQPSTDLSRASVVTDRRLSPPPPLSLPSSQRAVASAYHDPFQTKEANGDWLLRINNRHR